MFGCLTVLLLAASQPNDDWKQSESQYLKNIRQLTFQFERAGEAYFSPDGKSIIFQAEDKDSGNPFYQIYTQELSGQRAIRVSPGVGKTTCAYFRPDGKKIIFASSHEDAQAKEKYAPEYKQREDDKKAGVRRRYVWDFDKHMDIYEANPDGSGLKKLTDKLGYDAEGSYSADGKHIVFASQRDGDFEPSHCQLWIMDSDGKNARQLTKAPNCYNGGPFFSPDGKRVIFRSDRDEKDRLQIFAIDADGKNERQLTKKPTWVCWGPYWHPDGKHIVYAGADHKPGERPNYDIWWMNVETRKETRITHAPGADVLPVFSPDGTKMMWTSTRDGRLPSQIYIADFDPPKD